MQCGITIMDYSSDWALRNHSVEPKAEPGYMSREDVVALYGTLDIDGIELLHPYWEDCTPAYLKQLAADADLPIVTYIFSRDLAVPPSARDAVVDDVRTLLDRTVALGAPFAMIHPSRAKDEFSLDDQRGWLIDGLRTCAEYAQSIGVTMIAENIDDPTMRPLHGRGEAIRSICSAVDSPAFRLIYDSAAPLFVEEDPLETLETMLPYVVHVHVKNIRPLEPEEQAERYRDSVGGTRYTGTTLDSGVIDLSAILRVLDRAQYDGYLSIEYQGEDDPRIALSHNVEHLRGVQTNI